MTSVRHFKYTNRIISEIDSWPFGSNWPCVYVFYNQSTAYVGETLDAKRRTTQHKAEASFDIFTDVCFISDKTFNKSVIIDLESFLIKYISADGTKSLINSNAGIVDHNYFYREAYEDDFKEVWKELISLGIVTKTIFDIENSELFKYSPYKTLSEDQHQSAFDIIKYLSMANNASSKTLIEVVGGAGTGKTILAVFLIKLLTDIANNRVNWTTIDEYETGLSKLENKLGGIKKIGFVVPMIELRDSMKKVFSTISGLNPEMVISAGEATENYYDLLVVDEAHRLYQRKHLTSSTLFQKFDRINKQLMGDEFSTEPDKALTELDWIIKSSRLQILFYDELQRIRTPDIPQSRFDMICKPRLMNQIALRSQMRCKGGNGYYEYVKTVLEGKHLSPKEYCKIENYSLKTVDSFEALQSAIDAHRKTGGLSDIVAGPAWELNEKIIIEGQTLQWGSGITSIHKIQGFDLNYAGVLFGREVYYDKEQGLICVDKKLLKDKHAKSSGDEWMRRYVINIYLTLMTRGINGTYVYALDDNLREYLKFYFN